MPLLPVAAHSVCRAATGYICFNSSLHSARSLLLHSILPDSLHLCLAPLEEEPEAEGGWGVNPSAPISCWSGVNFLGCLACCMCKPWKGLLLLLSLFLAALGLHSDAWGLAAVPWLSLVAVRGGLLSSCGTRPSHCRGFSCCVCGLSSCDARASLSGSE